MYSMGWFKPLAFSASLYAGEALSNSVLSQDKLDILLPMPLGRCFRMAGGWLDWELMYSGGLSGFPLGQNFSVVRLSVMSRKFTILRFACTVILRPTSSKIWWNFFLGLSVSVLKFLP